LATANERMVRVFERAGPDYRAATAPFIDAVADLVVRRMEVGRGAVVVDLAAGPATVFLALQRSGLRRVEASGIDLSDRQLQAGRNQLTELHWTARMVHADVENVDVKDDSVDAVTCSLGLPYFTDPLRVIREAARIARPGAAVVFTTFGRPLFGGAGDRLVSAMNRIEAPVVGAPAAHDPEMLAQWCFRPGLKDVVIEEHDIPVQFPNFEAWWTAMQMLGFLVRLEDVPAESVEAVRDSLREDERVVGPTGAVPLLVRVLLMRAQGD
jgi:ubiquinone/menaquinone biosynthesis C-methylase UbiE